MTLAGANHLAEIGFIAKPKKVERGDFQQTYSGLAFYALDPRPEDISIIDIASALSKQCRYAGQCQRFLSIAEHSVHVSKAFHWNPPVVRLTALMHDASEAYLSDIVRPVKQQLPQYVEIEAKIEKVISDKYGLIYPLPAYIKKVDRRIVLDEREQNLGPVTIPWPIDAENLAPLGITLQYWSPERSKEEFLDAFYINGGVE
jgi:hypothetical protein